ATARPRPTWYGVTQPSVQARPQSSPPPTGFGNVIQQRPVAVPPPAATPHVASGTSPQPAPQATAPVARSNGEQPQVKERWLDLRSMTRERLLVLLRVAVWVLVGACVLVFARRLDWNQVSHAFQGVDLGLALLA